MSCGGGQPESSDERMLSAIRRLFSCKDGHILILLITNRHQAAKQSLLVLSVLTVN